MPKFLIFYFVFYGGANLYFYLKLRLAFPLSGTRGKLLAIPLALIFIAPLMSRVMEEKGLETAAGVAAFTGYWWMGLLFLFVTASFFLDLLNLALRLTGKLSQRRPVIPAKLCVVIPAIYTMLVAAYGWHEAKGIRTEHLTITTAKLPANRQKLRIVQISDVHAGQIVREERIKDILAVVSAASPDLLVSTGDLVDGHQRHFRGLEPLFQGIRPPLGKYAIPGNHEYYVGLDKAIAFTRNAGFRVLQDESVVVGDCLNIVGMNDSRNKTIAAIENEEERNLLGSQDRDRFTLLLKHRPNVLPDSVGRFDLQLSGHVHKGQIFPFYLLTLIEYPIRTGLTNLGKGSLIYVSRGTGVWGPPIRFMAPPEVTVIDLVAEKSLSQ